MTSGETRSTVGAARIARAVLTCAMVLLCALTVSQTVSRTWKALFPPVAHHARSGQSAQAAQAAPLINQASALTGDGPRQLPATLLPAGYRVGALVPLSSPTQHYCTASVIDSPHHDLLVTAAHCVHNGAGGGYIGGAGFSPGTSAGPGPAGLWKVRAAVVDPAWIASSDPSADFALVVLAPRQGRAIEEVVGGNPLTIGRTPASVGLLGFPADTATPHSCHGTALADRAQHQYHVYCPGFSAGTSGSPWLAGPRALYGSGNVIGVIGGYQRGGPSDDDSYSSPFDARIAALYNRAVALG